MSAWLQDNMILLLGGLVVAWMLWQRLIAPRLSGVKTMTASDYFTFRSQPHVLVDVRTTGEWNNGHAPKAKHMPLDQFGVQMQRLPQDKPVVLLCASGMRSAAAAAKLARSGHPQIYNFSGGMAAWQGAGLPVTRK